MVESISGATNSSSSCSIPRKGPTVPSKGQGKGKSHENGATTVTAGGTQLAASAKGPPMPAKDSATGGKGSGKADTTAGNANSRPTHSTRPRRTGGSRLARFLMAQAGRGDFEEVDDFENLNGSEESEKKEDVDNENGDAENSDEEEDDPLGGAMTKVTITFMNGNEKVVNIGEQRTIAELKEKIVKRVLKKQVIAPCVSFGDEVLNDAMTVKDAGIRVFWGLMCSF